MRKRDMLSIDIRTNSHRIRKIETANVYCKSMYKFVLKKITNYKNR